MSPRRAGCGRRTAARVVLAAAGAGAAAVVPATPSIAASPFVPLLWALAPAFMWAVANAD